MDHPVELKAVEPTDRGLAASGDLFEDLMAMNPAVMAHHQGGGVDKGDPRCLPLPGLEINAQRNECGGDQGHQPVITEPLREGTSQVPADMKQVKRFEVAVMRLMKMNQDGHEFAQHEAATAAAVTLTMLELLAVPVGQEQTAEVIDI